MSFGFTVKNINLDMYRVEGNATNVVVYNKPFKTSLQDACSSVSKLFTLIVLLVSPIHFLSGTINPLAGENKSIDVNLVSYSCHLSNT